MIAHALYAQSTIGLSGRVLDEQGKPVPGVVIVASPSGEHTVTTAQGEFLLSGLTQGNIVLKAQIMGYETHVDTLWMQADIANHIVRLKPASYQLETVTISEDAAERTRREASLNVQSVDREFMARNISTDMMSTLDNMPGVSSIEIGSGQSKPVIRGLGFNRVVVAESGIKHEAQQWGVDHGLEIDQFNIASAEVIKGPASLMYGSDAIGGVIAIKPFEIPAENGITGEVLLTGRTNNNLLGTSAAVSVRKNQAFLILRLTGITHGDYRVPVDTVTYNTYDFVLKDHYLRNTAGRELNAFVAGGITGRRVISTLSIGNYHRRSGFYADAHGFEIRNSEIDYDASNRDIDLPYQEVNHLKVTSENTVIFDEHKLDIDLSYQNNLRREFTEPVEHGYRPLPPDSLEREFNKEVFTANVQMKHLFSERHKMTSGVNLEYQHNRIGGWGFIIPAFRRFSAGAFVYDKFRLSEKLMLNSGIRLDYGRLETYPYRDWYPTPVFDDEGNLVKEQYVLRSPGIEKQFTEATWSLGLNYTADPFLAKLNLGKSFRMPDARELGADGVNYHLFRQEKGDSTLTAETAWQADLSLEYTGGPTTAAVSGFVTWFPNYIYLNPTSAFSEETGLQVFNYVQNEVIRWGGEVEVTQKLGESFSAAIGGEYVYSEQMSGNKEGFGLPFSPPLSGMFSLSWEPGVLDMNNDTYVSIETKVAARQDRVVPPEEPTAGYQVVNFLAGTTIEWGTRSVDVHLRLNNLLNTAYYNHTSYYRIINIPEPGRNLQLSLKLNF